MNDGFICEPEEAPYESWMSDAAWQKANERHGHKYFIRTKFGVSRACDTMAFVAQKDFCFQLFYGNPYLNPADSFFGFASRYNTLNPNEAQNAVNVIDGRGRAGDLLTSAFVVTWGLDTSFMITPTGDPPSCASELGLVIANWRHTGRIVNIAAIDTLELEVLLAQLLLRLPPITTSRRRRRVIYLNNRLARLLPKNDYCGIPIREMPICDGEGFMG